jgi:CheY-like chemotaxis protein
LTANKLIVLADDDPEVRDLLTSIVGLELNVLVAEAEDGDEVLRVVARDQPALVLVDVVMPRLSGFEVAKRLKANPATRSIPVVAISGGATRAEALAAGCDDFIAKPFDVDAFVDTLRRWLE